MRAHQAFAASENQQRHQREGQAEAEHGLAEDQSLERIEAVGDDGDSGNHGEQAAQKNAHAHSQKTLNNYLTGHSADARGRKSRAQQRDAKGGAGELTEERPKRRVSGLNRIDLHAAPEKNGGSHDDHGRIDQPSAVHGQQNVNQLHLAVVMAVAVFGDAARKDQRGVQINDVRHHRGAKHGNRQVDRRGVNFGNESVKRDGTPGRFADEHLESISDADERDEHHDHSFEPLKAEVLDQQDAHHHHAGENRRGKHRDAEEQIKAESRSQKLGQIGG